MPIKEQVLNKYKNDIFVETGTGCGYGVVSALDCGFRKVYSIEINENNFVKSKERFKDNINVYLFKGDSIVILPQVLTFVDASTTFWLDAHVDTRFNPLLGKKRCPILEEIDIIMTNHAFDKTIMIDDMRLFRGKGQKIWDYVTDKDIINAFSKYGYYSVKYEDGFQEEDVMVVELNQGQESK